MYKLRRCRTVDLCFVFLLFPFFNYSFSLNLCLWKQPVHWQQFSEVHLSPCSDSHFRIMAFFEWAAAWQLFSFQPHAFFGEMFPDYQNPLYFGILLPCIVFQSLNSSPFLLLKDSLSRRCSFHTPSCFWCDVMLSQSFIAPVPTNNIFNFQHWIYCFCSVFNSI